MTAPESTPLAPSLTFASPEVAVEGPSDGPAPGPAPTVGDGTTSSSRARARWRTWRWPLLTLAIILGVTFGSSIFSPRTSTVPFAPDNAKGGGARALAQVLAREGVNVTYVKSTSEAISLARPGVSVLIVNGFLLPDETALKFAASGADLVLFAPEAALLEAASDGRIESAQETSAGLTERPASCENARGIAAGAITSTGSGYRARLPASADAPASDASAALDDEGVSICFPFPEAATASEAGSYAELTRAGGARLSVFDDTALITNSEVLTAGNGALALAMAGASEELVWFMPDPNDFFGDSSGGGKFALLPAQSKALVYLAGALGLALMVWRGRRLGPVVAEQLPVLVQSAEATRGRGRLYRRARSYGHAAAALRAGTADRVAAKIGLPRSAGAQDLIDGLHRATGHDPDHIAGLLYGPPPTTDSDLVRLTAALDQLENEVYHR